MTARDRMDDEPDLFAAIRAACREVSQRARHVRIDASRVAAWVKPRLDHPLTVPDIDLSSHIVSDPPTTVAFFVTLAAVNFGSGSFPFLRKRQGRSGYFTIATALKERFDTHGPWSAEALARIAPADCARVFGQDLSHPVVGNLMTQFAEAWNDLGRDLIARHASSFSDCIESAGHRASRLVRALSRQPFFRDVARYRDFDVPLYKRAQLLASDLALALRGAGLGRFDDLDRLTIFADNLVPHVLRSERLLVYSDALSRAIASEQLLPSGSEEEVELRACSLHAAELIVEEAAAQGASWTARDVDQVLWHRGQLPHIKRWGKRHRTRTVFY